MAIITHKFVIGQRVKCIRNDNFKASREGYEGAGWRNSFEFKITRITHAKESAIIYWEAAGGGGVYEEFLEALPTEWNKDENY